MGLLPAVLAGCASGREWERNVVLGAIPLLEIACQLLMFVNVAELWFWGNMGYSGLVS